MARIGFVGLGNMGGPMAINLVKAGHDVAGFDIVTSNLDGFVAAGGTAAATASEAVAGAEVIITMLPAGQHVNAVYAGPDGLIANASDGALLIDCSTIDVDTARTVASASGERSRRRPKTRLAAL